MAQMLTNGWSTVFLRIKDGGKDDRNVVLSIQEYRDTARVEMTRKEAKHLFKQLRRALRQSGRT